MSTKSRFLVGFGIAVLLVGAYLATAIFLGAPIGEPCDKEWGCKGANAVCLEGEAAFCSRHCESASECPSGWSCGDVSVLTFDGKSAEPEESSTPVCLPPS